MAYRRENFGPLGGILLKTISQAARGLHPAYFALVMATGIVSMACHQQGFDFLAWGLFYLNIGAYGILWVLTVWRAFRFWSFLAADISSHSLAPGYFTIVAGTGVLGSQVLIIGELPGAAFILWVATLVLWLGLTYTIFTVLIVKEEKPSLAEGLNGGWLVAVVAAQSASVLGSTVAQYAGSAQDTLLLLTFVIWLFGGMLYIWIISLIFYRYLFFQFLPEDMTPPYWINMGAVAISTLAGATLMAESNGLNFFDGIRPFLTGLTFFFWATATWWIPMLVILFVWRHACKKFPLAYNPQYWGAVFPLGMYTACTYTLAESAQLASLLIIPRIFIFIALAAWAVVFTGLIRHMLRNREGAGESK
ncbi:MAG: tellurite resistance/C4-dicarboxylate transporter family protein [Desulfohalobiaceae bacterium]|nr:tellurite resistance/C4-dicarboxylate transporter family protein [Desulfohalobiaceae bacterium]